MRTADHIPANYQVAPLVPIAPLNPANNIEPADDTLDSHDDHLEGFDLLQHLPNSPHHSALINSELSSRSGSMTWDTIHKPNSFISNTKIQSSTLYTSKRFGPSSVKNTPRSSPNKNSDRTQELYFGPLLSKRSKEHSCARPRVREQCVLTEHDEPPPFPHRIRRVLIPPFPRRQRRLGPKASHLEPVIKE